MKPLHPLALAVVLSLDFVSAQASIQIFNSQHFPDNATFLSQWLSATGVSQPQHTVDFETGFVDGQNVASADNLFPGGMVIRSTDNAAIVRTGQVFGGTNQSNPLGLFALLIQDSADLTLDFSSQPVDYVAFYDIDHTASRILVEFSDDTDVDISIETTSIAGDSAEFYGIFRNNMPPIKRVTLRINGDGSWGLDNILYGSNSPFARFNIRLDSVEASQVIQHPLTPAPMIYGIPILLRAFVSQTCFATEESSLNGWTAQCRVYKNGNPSPQVVFPTGGRRPIPCGASSFFAGCSEATEGGYCGANPDTINLEETVNFKLMFKPGEVVDRIVVEVNPCVPGAPCLPEITRVDNVETIFSFPLECRRKPILRVGKIRIRGHACPPGVTTAADDCPDEPIIREGPRLLNTVFPIPGIRIRKYKPVLEIASRPADECEVEELLRKIIVLAGRARVNPAHGDMLLLWSDFGPLNSPGISHPSSGAIWVNQQADSQKILAHEAHHVLAEAYGEPNLDCFTGWWPCSWGALPCIGRRQLATSHVGAKCNSDHMSAHMARRCNGFVLVETPRDDLTNSGGGRDPVWLAFDTYKNLIDKTRTKLSCQGPSPAPIAGELPTLVLVGRVELDPLVVNAVDVIAFSDSRELTFGPFTKESPINVLLYGGDQADTLLAEYPLFLNSLTSESFTGIGFALTIPAVIGETLSVVAKLQVIDSATKTVLFETTRSPNAPEIMIKSPHAGDTLTEPTTVSWSVFDADDDNVIVDVSYSHDNGETFDVVYSGAGDSFVLDPSTVPGSRPAEGIIEMTGRDGLNVTGIRIEGLTVGERFAPAVRILREKESPLYVGTSEIISAEVLDDEDITIDPSGIVWSSSIDGIVQTGEDFEAYSLSLGTHVLTVTATDSDGMTSSDAIILHVTQQPSHCAGDLSCDGVIGTGEMKRFRECMHGPYGELTADPQCLGLFDYITKDGAVDLHDFADFQRRYNQAE